jgi:hypothetical protein
MAKVSPEPMSGISILSRLQQCTNQAPTSGDPFKRGFTMTRLLSIALLLYACTVPSHRLGDVSPAGLNSANPMILVGIGPDGGLQPQSIDGQGNLKISQSSLINTAFCPLDAGTAGTATCTFNGAGCPSCVPPYGPFPGLSSATTVVDVNPVIPGTGALTCSAVVQAPGGDAGQIVVTCLPGNYGTDGGYVNIIRVN